MPGRRYLLRVEALDVAHRAAERGTLMGMRALFSCALLLACSGDASSSKTITPSQDGGSPPGDSASADDAPVSSDARAYNLEKVNAYRKQAGVPPLALDDKLDDFAQAASTELSQDHAAHQYFMDHAKSCGCGIMSENQGDANGIPPADVHTQIDEILGLMMSGGPGEPHHDNIVSPSWTRLGAGIVNPGGRMYFTNDFGP
jgi:uncharacterized protein YkwD